MADQLGNEPVGDAARVPAGMPIALEWNQSLHPRGRDGRLIEKFGFVEILSGMFEGIRGTVVGSDRIDVHGEPKDRVHVQVIDEDTGEPNVIKVLAKNVNQLAAPKAHLPKTETSVPEDVPEKIPQDVLTEIERLRKEPIPDEVLEQLGLAGEEVHEIDLAPSSTSSSELVEESLGLGEPTVRGSWPKLKTDLGVFSDDELSRLDPAQVITTREFFERLQNSDLAEAEADVGMYATPEKPGQTYRTTTPREYKTWGTPGLRIGLPGPFGTGIGGRKGKWHRGKTSRVKTREQRQYEAHVSALKEEKQTLKERNAVRRELGLKPVRTYAGRDYEVDHDERQRVCDALRREGRDDEADAMQEEIDDLYRKAWLQYAQRDYVSRPQRDRDELEQREFAAREAAANGVWPVETEGFFHQDTEERKRRLARLLDELRRSYEAQEKAQRDRHKPIDAPPAVLKPDWHPDPIDPSRMRYWDGKMWTDWVTSGPGGTVVTAPFVVP